MCDTITFYIHKDTLYKIDSFLKKKDEMLIDAICHTKALDKNTIINTDLHLLKYNTSYNQRKCFARLWRGGEGGECCNHMNINNKEYCNFHETEIKKNGKLRYGRIDEISPFRLSKNLSEPYKRCKHFKNDKQCNFRINDNNDNYCTKHNNLITHLNI